MNMHTTIVCHDGKTANAEWNAMLAALQAATHLVDHHNATVFKPMYRYIQATAPRPDLCFEITARSGQTARYMVPPQDLHAWDHHICPEFRQKAAAIREAWLSYRSLCGLMGWDVVCDEQDRLCDIQSDLEAQLILTPAPRRAALYWKLDRLFGSDVRKDDDFGAAWCADWLNVVMADARRLLA